MQFKKRENSDESCINEWVAGDYVIAELRYALGQHRIQIWHLGSPQRRYPWPDVLDPVF